VTRSIGVIPRPLGSATGIVLDRLLGEPPTSVHPVVHFGEFMERLERRNYRDTRTSGIIHAVIGASIGLGSGSLIRSTSLTTGAAVGANALWAAAHDVGAALERNDLEHARALLPTLVGRDPHDLGESEIARAVVESVAENTVDAVVAPALWAALAGAPGAFGYRAVNTMDAMVGHHSPRYENYGWASARLDDAANWVPARSTAALVALVRPAARGEIRRAVATQSRAHPSPNAGVVEAAFAAALGLRLGGRNNYYGVRVEDRPMLGRGRGPRTADIALAVRLSRDVTTALTTILVLVGCVRWWTR
jgi:adenosylcobinamide-phosphate synthase